MSPSSRVIENTSRIARPSFLYFRQSYNPAILTFSVSHGNSDADQTPGKNRRHTIESRPERIRLRCHRVRLERVEDADFGPELHTTTRFDGLREAHVELVYGVEEQRVRLVQTRRDRRLRQRRQL